MSVSIPSSLTLDIPLDVRAAVNADMRANVAANVNATVAADVAAKVDADVKADVNGTGALTMTLLGDREHPVAVAAAVDASLFLKNLPVFTYEQIHCLIDSLKPRMRVRAPFHFNFGVSVFPLNLFGVDALQLSLCGEPQLIIEDCPPCEVECEPCDPCGR
jgi:hypothetical protein